MSFYQQNLHPEWSQCYQYTGYSQYTGSSSAQMNQPQLATAVVPTLSPEILEFEELYSSQYKPSYGADISNINQQMPAVGFTNVENSFMYGDIAQFYNQRLSKGQQANTHLPPLNANSKKISKPKRNRTVFKIGQVEALEQFYKYKQYATQKDRQQLQKTLQISDKTIKVWFQNRRLKDRRESKQISSADSNLEHGNASPQSDTDIIQEIDQLTEEMQRKQEKDDLDDFLLSVISAPSDSNQAVKQVPAENVFYEPVSPAESCEEQKPLVFEPKELLKTFLNFQD